MSPLRRLECGDERSEGLILIQMSSPSPQPQRGCDPKPRVGPSADLPWVCECEAVQPQGGCGSNDLHPPSERRVATPSGLIDYLMRLPRVARASQPWALGRSPFGAGKVGLCIRINRSHRFGVWHVRKLRLAQSASTPEKKRRLRRLRRRSPNASRRSKRSAMRQPGTHEE